MKIVLSLILALSLTSVASADCATAVCRVRAREMRVEKTVRVEKTRVVRPLRLFKICCHKRSCA